ncbi:MAG: restriction endonuclease subunit S [Vibrio sp.]|uniref:restriction endonuclease subunit S n=1 Tax=Vibrio sp. TaxID=678 RepID=UPI001EB2BF04|nr:restriction endonuclease subunit S [Vibrio sp.]NRB69780.1 restriction endonuclease subunit S [Vibrio sp.]
MKLVTLDSVLTFHRGITFKPDDKVAVGSSDSVVCFRTKNIQKELDESDLLAVPSSFVKRDELYVNQGDILISTANSWELVGKCVRVAKTQYKSTIGGFISMLRPKTELIDPDYLYRFLSMEVTQERIRHLGKKTTNISNLDRVRFLQLEIPLPPLETQKQIAAVLEKADQLRKDCQQMEQELNGLAQSVFIDMFGDPVTNPKGWEMKALSELASIVTGNTPSRAKPEYYGSDIEWIKSGNINTPSDFLTVAEEYLSEDGKKAGRVVQSGAILMTCIAGSPDCIGNIAIADREVAFNQQINALVPMDKKLDTEFLYVLLKVAKKIIQSASTNSMKGMISKSKLESIQLPFPSYAEQCDFSAIFKKLQKEVKKQNEQVVETQLMFDALMQKAFKGELNL